MSEIIDKKDSIRKNYGAGFKWKEEDVDIYPITVVPPKFDTESHQRVCAYARVSTDSEKQTTSLVLQQISYQKMIEENPNWEYVGLYYDEGKSGTSVKRRKGFLKMIEDCKAGKIDMILTKSVARFARNTLDSLKYIKELKNLDPPVGVYFETEKIYSLDSNKMMLVNLSSLAEWESESKSNIMNWSIDKRFELGQFLTPVVYGYKKDDNDNLVINEAEAPFVRLFYYLFLQGFSVNSMAEIAMGLNFEKDCEEGIEWYGKSILNMLQNEKYCGELIARKTYTPDFSTHKSKKNKGNKTQYHVRNHHPAIVSPQIYAATLKLIDLHKKVNSGYTLPKLSVVKKGALKGYIPIDRNWDGYSFEEYEKACRTVYKGITNTQETVAKEQQGYIDVGEQLFSSKEDIYITFFCGLVSFNMPCVESIQKEYVSLYFNPLDLRMAVVEAQYDGRNFQWAKKKEEWKLRPKSIKGFDSIIYERMKWNRKARYRIKGKTIIRNGQKALIFDLNSAELCLGDSVVYPKHWEEDFGSKLGRIRDEEFSQEQLIVSYRDCSDIACALPDEAMEELTRKVEETFGAGRFFR